MTNSTLNEVRLRTLNQIEERFCPPDILSSPEFWDHIASMVNQTLEVKRMVFFERVPEKPQLLETKAFNCAFDEVQMKERTLDATMFSAAVAAGSPVRTPGFFKPAAAPEEEFL